MSKIAARNQAAQFATCCLALSLSYAVVLSLSEGVYAAMGASSEVRALTSVVSTGALVVLAMASTWRPSWLGPRTATFGCAGLLALGAVGVLVGFFGGGTLPGTVGLTFLFMAGSFSILLVKAGCVSMKPQAILGCVFASFLLGHVWSYAFSFLGPLATLVACIAITAFVLAASHPYYRPLLERIKATDAPGVLAATRPRAFLPFGHQVFIYLALFNFAHGYLLSFSSTGATTSNSLFTVAIILVVGIVLVVRKGRMFPDALFAVSVLLVTGGILLAPIAEVDGDFAALFLAAGVACFNLLYLYALLVISSKNKINTIPVLAWGASIESFFMLAGGMAGQGILQAFAADHTAVSVLSVMVVLVILGCILFTIRSFSFDRTIADIEPDSSLSLASHSEAWERRCAEIAAQAGLTQREQEVFVLLARGRNSPYIQKELVITNNTVKAHVKHIYQKLGVNSHQQLIDLVDARTT